MNPQLLLLAEVLPVIPATRWEFWAVLVYLTLQSLVQLYQVKQARRIEKQTNGMVANSVDAAGVAGEARGEAKGRIQEQERVAAGLAISDEVAANLERAKHPA
jgi:hypothetical protein